MAQSGDYECDAVSVSPQATCVEVADLMDAKSVGCVVVVVDDAPVGVLTDRDLCCRVVAAGRDPKTTVAGDVMTQDPVTGGRGDNVLDLLGAMRTKSVRRIPLVEEGRLVGLLSLDDLIMEISSELFNVSHGLWEGLHESHRTARNRRRHESREDALEEMRRNLADLGEQARDYTLARLESLLEMVGGRRP